MQVLPEKTPSEESVDSRATAAIATAGTDRRHRPFPKKLFAFFPFALPRPTMPARVSLADLARERAVRFAAKKTIPKESPQERTAN